MRNLHLRKTTAADIDRQVAKVLRGLGNPKPPLCLDDVRRLLKLDREYYSKTSDGILRETVSRLMVAGKQILRRPALLLEAILKAELKALYVPDRKIILLDETEPDIKQRWNESHEIVHSLLEWHGSVMLGDDRITLNLACHEQIEAEANFGSGRLLFLQEQFESAARDSKCCMEEIRALGTPSATALRLRSGVSWNSWTIPSSGSLVNILATLMIASTGSSRADTSYGPSHLRKSSPESMRQQSSKLCAPSAAGGSTGLSPTMKWC